MRGSLLCGMMLWSVVCVAEGFFKRKGDIEKEEALEQSIDDMGLVGMVGRLVFDVLNEYQWYIKLMTGYWLDKQMTVMCISVVCNLIYCLSVVGGMFIFSQNTMLIYGLLTIFIGPAIILVGIGLLALIIGAMALYPMISVSIFLLTWFFTTKLGQLIGKKLGLDCDNDGDVDFADFIHLLARYAPKWMNLKALHDWVDKRDKSVIEEVQELRKAVEELKAELAKRK